MRNENAQSREWEESLSTKKSMFSDRQSDKGLQDSKVRIAATIQSRKTEQHVSHGKKKSHYRAKNLQSSPRYLLAQEMNRHISELEASMKSTLNYSEKGTLKRISSVGSQNIEIQVDDLNAQAQTFQLNAASGQFAFMEGQLLNPVDIPIDGVLPRRVLVSKPNGDTLTQSNMTESVASSHWHEEPHHMGE